MVTSQFHCIIVFLLLCYLFHLSELNDLYLLLFLLFPYSLSMLCLSHSISLFVIWLILLNTHDFLLKSIIVIFTTLLYGPLMFSQCVLIQVHSQAHNSRCPLLQVLKYFTTHSIHQDPLAQQSGTCGLWVRYGSFQDCTCLTEKF